MGIVKLIYTDPSDHHVHGAGENNQEFIDKDHHRNEIELAVDSKNWHDYGN